MPERKPDNSRLPAVVPLRDYPPYDVVGISAWANILCGTCARAAYGRDVVRRVVRGNPYDYGTQFELWYAYGPYDEAGNVMQPVYTGDDGADYCTHCGRKLRNISAR